MAERGEGTCDLFSVGATIDVAELPAMGASECSASAFGGGTASALEVRLLVTAGDRIAGPNGSMILPLDQRCKSSRASFVRSLTLSVPVRAGGTSMVLNNAPQLAQKTR